MSFFCENITLCFEVYQSSFDAIAATLKNC